MEIKEFPKLLYRTDSHLENGPFKRVNSQQEQDAAIADGWTTQVPGMKAQGAETPKKRK